MSLYNRGLASANWRPQFKVSGDDGVAGGMAGIGVLLVVFVAFAVLRGPDRLRGGK